MTQSGISLRLLQPWGGNPDKDAVYLNVVPAENDGLKSYRLTVKDVPVDGFWSISVYNSDGYYEKNAQNAYTLNNLTAKKNADGSVTVQFGACDGGVPNCLPICPVLELHGEALPSARRDSKRQLDLPQSSAVKLSPQEVIETAIVEFLETSVNRFQTFVIAVLFASSGCSSTLNAPAPEPAPTISSQPQSPIRHVIILFQENRSLNNLFMGFPGADTSTTGACKPFKPQFHNKICTRPGERVHMQQITLETTGGLGGVDIEHSHATFEAECNADKNGCRMDGFDTINFGTTGGNGPALFYPYAFVERSEVRPYWDMASRYTLADHMFSTATTDSFVAHQQIIAGTTRLNSHESLTDTPSALPWGCDSPTGTVTGVIHSNGHVNDFGGPFPCLTQYKTMADVLDARAISWKFYVMSYDLNSPYANFSGEVWNAFDAIKSVRYGPDWKNVSIPNTNVFSDIKKGSLPQVSWVIPTIADSDHPASGYNRGPSWVTSVVNAVGKSRYWKSTAIVVVWDDWGGYYDNVPPPQLDYTSLGMRVPMILISPYAKRHYVSKTQYEFGSVLKFIEQTFGTASLGSTDVRANSIGDAFDFSQQPSKFQPFAAPYGENYLLREHEPQSSSRQLIEKDGGIPD